MGKRTYLLKSPNVRQFSFNIKISSDGCFVAVSQKKFFTQQETIKILRPHGRGVDAKFHDRGDHISEYFEDLWDSGQSSSHAWLLGI